MQSKLPNVGTTIFTVMSGLATEYNAINLAQGFPNFPPSERLQALLTSYMAKGMNQYAPMTGVPVLREAIATLVKTCYGATVNADTDITVTAGATQAMFTAISTFVHAGDEVIIIEPAYDAYIPAIELSGGVVVPYPAIAPDYAIDWSAFARLISAKTRLIIINTPHNPTGSLFSASDWDALEALVAGTDILILSDEVYEHLTFDGVRHESVLRRESLRDRSIAVASFGKTFHNTGWRVGYAIAPAPLMKEFRKLHQYITFSINTPAQYALADYMQDADTYLSLPSFYAQKRALFLDILAQTKLVPLPCRGSFFQLADYSAVSDLPDRDFAELLVKTYGVAAIPLSPFRTTANEERIIRFCFAKTDDTLSAAGERLAKLA